jgi:hypothetical protein
MATYTSNALQDPVLYGGTQCVYRTYRGVPYFKMTISFKWEHSQVVFAGKVQRNYHTTFSVMITLCCLHFLDILLRILTPCDNTQNL